MARPKAFDTEQAQMKAMRLFWRKGYAATSIDDLVETLQLSRSSLYDTFGDKHALFLGALKLYSKRVIAGTTRTMQEAETPLAAIQKVFDDLANEAATESGAMGCFMVNSVAELVPYDGAVTTIAAAYGEAIEGLLTRALSEAASQGTIKTRQTPDDLAAYVFNAIQGMRVLIKAGASKGQIQAIGEIVMSTLRV